MALLLLPYGCLVTVNVLWFFLKVPWVGLQFVIVVFPVHNYLILMSSLIGSFTAQRLYMSLGMCSTFFNKIK